MGIWTLLSGVGWPLLLHRCGWSLPGWFSSLSIPLDFHGRLGIIRTVFIPGALHGFEASFLADSSWRKLRAAIFRVVWSDRQPLASTGAVL